MPENDERVHVHKEILWMSMAVGIFGHRELDDVTVSLAKHLSPTCPKELRPFLTAVQHLGKRRLSQTDADLLVALIVGGIIDNETASCGRED